MLQIPVRTFGVHHGPGKTCPASTSYVILTHSCDHVSVPDDLSYDNILTF